MTSAIGVDPIERAPLISTTAATSPGESRLHVLDLLRGIALLGMFVIHFYGIGAHGSEQEGLLHVTVGRFLDGRFYTMFGILFGVGFAIQLERSAARGERFAARFLRRLLALAIFGFIAEGIFGYNVLLGYAYWAIPLLLVGRWSTRALIVLLLVCTPARPIYNVTTAAYAVNTGQFAEFVKERQAQNRAFNAARIKHDSTEQSTAAKTVIAGRLEFMPAFHRQWNTLPDGAFVLFLFGLLGYRLKLFSHPELHRKLIVAVMGFGAVSWAVAEWMLPIGPPMAWTDPAFSIPGLIKGIAQANAFRLPRHNWLALTYIGAVLLFVSWRRGVPSVLAPFRWAGRMALTNYMAQVMLLDLLFSPYALGLKLTPMGGIFAALALFAIFAAASQWWLTRYYMGPLEWVWRWATRLQRPPFRRSTSPA